MKITTTGRKVNLKQNFLSLVEEKLGKLDKFFPAEVQATVTVTVEKDWQTVEIAIKDRAAYFRSEKSAPSMELALEDAVEKLESLIVKNKSKISRKHKGNAYKYEELPVLPAGETEEEEYEITGSMGAHIEENKISNESPMGASLLGHKQGETVTVHLPNGNEYELVIKKVELA